MVDREERQLEAVGNAGFVEDGAHVIFDDLLFAREALGDFFIALAFDEQTDNLQYYGRKAFVPALADAFIFIGW